LLDTHSPTDSIWFEVENKLDPIFERELLIVETRFEPELIDKPISTSRLARRADFSPGPRLGSFSRKY